MKPILFAAALMLSACQREQRPPAPTAEESAQLNEVDDLLNRTANDQAADDMILRNGG